MSELVFIKEGYAVTDSLTVADVFEKRHADVIKSIESLHCSKEFNERNFSLIDYVDDRNRNQKKYLIKRDGLAFLVFGYTGLKAGEYKEKYIQAFNKMEQELRSPRVLTEKEQLVASMKLSIETSEEVGLLKNEVAEIKDTLKNKMTIDHAKQSILQSQINIRIAKLWDVEETRQNFSKRKLYSRLHSNLHRAFMVTSYKDVKDSEFDEALAWIQTWRPLV